MEALAYESNKTVVPAVCEIVLQFKYARGEASQRMLDLIPAGRVYTFGYIYDDWKGMQWTLPPDGRAAGGSSAGNETRAARPAVISRKKQVSRALRPACFFLRRFPQPRPPPSEHLPLPAGAGFRRALYINKPPFSDGFPAIPLHAFFPAGTLTAGVFLFFSQRQ